MKLFHKIRHRFDDMNKLKDTGVIAERIANEMGEALVGAEHWLLAALELPDGTAAESFTRAGVDASGLRLAISQQYQDALNDSGINTKDLALPEISSKVAENPPFTFSAQASCNALFAAMTDKSNFSHVEGVTVRFMGATVVHAAARLERGTVPRSLRTMGIDSHSLQQSAAQIILEVSTEEKRA